MFYLNKKGSQVLEFLIIIAVVAIIAILIFPSLNNALNNFRLSSIEKYENSDTSIDFD